MATVTPSILTAATSQLTHAQGPSSITFNDIYFKTDYIYYFNSAAGTYTLRASQGQNQDIFPDTLAVGDSVIIGCSGSTGYGKYNTLSINIQTALAATSVTGVWEYISGGTGTVPTWSSLAGVTDGTNSFQTTGTNTVVWTIPDDWENYHTAGGSTTTYYGWYVRFRITAVTAPTEGGKFANDSTGPVKHCPYNINVLYYPTEDKALFADIYAADVAGGWGMVTNNDAQYYFRCGLYINSASFLQTANEQICFKKSFDIWNQGALFSGLNYAGDKCYDGSNFIFQVYNSSLQGTVGRAKSEIYNTVFRDIPLPGWSSYNGHWGAAMGSSDDQKLFDLYVQGWRQVGFQTTTNSIGGIKIYNTQIENPGAVNFKHVLYGKTIATRETWTNAVVYSHQFDFSQVLMTSAGSGPINPYWMTALQDAVRYYIDCSWGDIPDCRKVIWTHGATPLSGNAVYEGYSALIRVIDEQKNAISGATVAVIDKDGTEVFSYSTNADGFAGEESGTITSASTTSLTDTDKSWTTDQYFYKELVITSSGAWGSELVTDGGMEIWTNSTTLTNWTKTLTGTSVLNQDTTAYHSGASSAKLTYATSGTVTIKQSITLEAGKPYTLGFWYKSSAYARYAHWRLRNSAYDVTLGLNGAWSTGTGGNNLYGNTEWQYFSVQFNAHESYTNYEIQLEVAGGGNNTSVWYDDVSLIPNFSGSLQRTIIKKGGTSTNLPFASSLAPAPGIGDRYIIVPYISTKKYEPNNLVASATCYSTITDSNPYTLTISKSGYKTYRKAFSILSPVNEIITLSNVKDLNTSKHVRIYTQ